MRLKFKPDPSGVLIIDLGVSLDSRARLMIDPSPLTDRRQALCGTAASILGLYLLGACASAPVLNPPRSDAQTGAEAAAVFAIISAALTTLNAIEALNAKGGGLGEQFAAIGVKLDQILRNQI